MHRGLATPGCAEQHGLMAFDVERLMRLWTDPPADDAAAVAAFRQLYADPVSVNGVQVRPGELVARARALGAVFEDLQREVLDVVDDGGKVAVAFRLRGRHVGTLGTSAGPVPATGRRLEIRVIDVLTVRDGLISSIWMVADELGALLALDAVRLSSAESAIPRAG